MKTFEEMRNDYLEPESVNYNKLSDEELTEVVLEELMYYSFDDLLEMLPKQDRIQYQYMFNQLLQQAIEVAKENLINQLSVKDFFNKFVSYTSKIAESMGRHLAIVVDDRCGMATTNRTVLYDYISNNYKHNNVILKNGDDNYFNGYDIVGKVYLL